MDEDAMVAKLADALRRISELEVDRTRVLRGREILAEVKIDVGSIPDALEDLASRLRDVGFEELPGDIQDVIESWLKRQFSVEANYGGH